MIFDDFWTEFFQENWELVKWRTQTYNILGMEHWAFRIEVWRNYRTKEEKIISTTWKNGTWTTSVTTRKVE